MPHQTMRTLTTPNQFRYVIDSDERGTFGATLYSINQHGQEVEHLQITNVDAEFLSSEGVNVGAGARTDNDTRKAGAAVCNYYDIEYSHILAGNDDIKTTEVEPEDEEEEATTEVGDQKQLRELEGEDYQLIQTSQDLAAVLEYVPSEQQEGMKLFTGDTIEGAVVRHGDGEYLEIWLTTTSAYYDLRSQYTRVV